MGEPAAHRAPREAASADEARVADDRVHAFGRLVDRELDHAYRLAAVILHDPLEAEDAVHDAAVVAWRRLGDLRDATRFEAWFTRILVNGCRDRLRARNRRKVVDLGRAPTEREHPHVADAVEATAIRDLLDRALDSLSPDEQVVVALRFDDDLTVPAIAATLGVPEGTVKSRLHQALRRLRAAVEEADR